MKNKLLIVAALFCSTASGMDRDTNENGDKPQKKRARTERTITAPPPALPSPFTPEDLLPKKSPAKRKSRSKPLSGGGSFFKLTTSLIRAIENRKPLTEIQRIISQGVDPNAPQIDDGYGNTPLIVAVKGNYKEACLLLIQSGANINGLDSLGNTPLHWVEDAEICTLLIQRGADINAPDKKGLTPLHCAAADGLPQVCRILLQAGANVNAIARQGDIPLHNAANPEICTLLREYGATIDALTKSGETPLYWAAKSGNRAVFRSLKQNGADPKILPTNDAKVPDLCQAARCGKLDACRLLLEIGVNIDASDDTEGYTALHWALESNHNDVVTVLLEHGPTINVASKKGETPLHSAARSGRATLSTLIERGAVVNAINSEGETPLHRAASSGLAASCTLLLKNGAKVNGTNNTGKTPLHLSLALGSQLFSVIEAPIVGGPIGSRYTQAFLTLLQRGGVACIIPTIPGDTTNKQRIFTALCTLRRLGQLIRLPREVSYLILASNKELRDDLLCSLLPHVQRNADNNTLPQTLKMIPLEFHDLLIFAVYQHTMAQIKETLATLHYEEVASVDAQFGRMMYHGIAQLLGAQLKTVQEPQLELFAA